MPLRHKIVALVATMTALLAVACGSAQAVTVTPPTPVSNSPGDTPISVVTATTGRVWLEAPNGTFQSGWATLSEYADGLRVEVQVAPSEAVAQPAHIHLGTCDQLGVIVHRLENVIGGNSITAIPDTGVKDVATGTMAVNLHLSFADFPTFTACGEIPALP